MPVLLSLMLAATPADAETIRAAVEPAPAPGYVMHAVRVGVTRGAKRATFIADESLGAHLDIAFAFWVLRGFKRVILIDTGFVDPGDRRRWRVQGYRDPVAGLAALGIQPTDVTDVVITHHHWDHIGGLVRFPQATVWIHQRALAGAAKSGDAEVTAVLRAADEAGRLHRTTSLQEIAPHVIVVHAGMHTAGFQWLLVDNHDGPWVFAADIVPLSANLERNRPTGLTTHPKGTLTLMATMRALVKDELPRIVTGHEPAGFGDDGILHLSP